MKRILLLLILLWMMLHHKAFAFNFSLLTNELVAYYTCDDNALDSLGMHDGDIMGAGSSFNRFGQLRSALEFDGKNDFVDLGLDFISSDSVSISLWLFPTAADSTTHAQFFLSSGQPDSTTGIYGIWQDGNLSVGRGFSDQQTENTFHSNLPRQSWHHIVMVFDQVNETALTYVNGALVHSENFISTSLIDAENNLYLGKSAFVSTQHFDGLLDEVRIYNGILSTDEIQQLYQKDCPENLSISNLSISGDTTFIAHTMIELDSFYVDTAENVYLKAPLTVIDSIHLSPLSRLFVKGQDGCNQGKPIYANHFEHRGIYINNFVTDGILGDTEKEDSLLMWCNQHGFNQVYLYNIGNALSSGMQADLDSFVYNAHHLESAIDVTFVSAGFGTSFTNIEAYHDNYDNLPVGIVSEIEFWNGSKTYAEDFAPWIEKLNSLKFDTVTMDSIVRNPNLIRRFYIGKIKNGGEPPSLDIAKNLVMHHDEIFLVNYHSDGFNLSTSTSENAIRNKLSLLGEAAYQLQKEVNIVLLFNVLQDSPAPQIWDYFYEYGSDRSFDDALRYWYKDFLDATDIDHKAYLNLKGYGIYRYTDAIVARGY